MHTRLEVYDKSEGQSRFRGEYSDRDAYAIMKVREWQRNYFKIFIKRAFLSDWNRKDNNYGKGKNHAARKLQNTT